MRFTPNTSGPGAKTLTADGALVPRKVDLCDKSTEIYEKFININRKKVINNKKIDPIREIFNSFNSTFLEILEDDNDRIWTILFGKNTIQDKTKFKNVLVGTTERIFEAIDNMAITDEQYNEKMRNEEDVESPMIPFEMMIFNLFEGLR